VIIGLQCSSKQKAAGLPDNLAECFLFVAHVPVRRVEHFSERFTWVTYEPRTCCLNGTDGLECSTTGVRGKRSSVKSRGKEGNHVACTRV